MATHYKGSKEEQRVLNAFVALIRAGESVLKGIAPALEEAGLTISQFGTLEALRFVGPLTQRELGEKLLRSGGNMTMVIDNLEKQGWVKRERGEEDRRCFRVSLTVQGKKVIDAAFARHLKLLLKQFSILVPTELEELRALCKAVGLQKR